MQRYYEINGQGFNVRCKVYFQEKTNLKRAVIFCTGFAGHKDNKAAERFAEKLLSKDRHAVVVVFNWPAHGDDEKKKLVLEDCSLYLEQVISDTMERYGVQELYAYATSFGGYLILKYISEHGSPFRRIALRCPAIDMYDVLTRTIMRNDEFERIQKGKEVEAGFDRKIIVTPSLLEDLKAADIRQRDFLDYAEDILILHGTKDEVVPLEDSQSFADNNLIEFIPIEGADHRFQSLVHMSLATKYVIEFFEKQ